MIKVITYTTLDNIATVDELDDANDLFRKNTRLRDKKEVIDKSLIQNKEIDEVEIEDFIFTGGFKLLSKWKLDVWNKTQIRNAEVLAEQLISIKEKKLNTIISGINRTLVIGDNTFSIDRIDIQKYNEATNISDGMGINVKLRSIDGDIELTIIEARAIIKELSEKALSEYWRFNDFVDLLNSASTKEVVDSLVF